MTLQQTIVLRRIINTYVIPAIGVILCIIAWQLRVRNDLLRHPAPTVIARSCPALLEDYQQLQWVESTCRGRSVETHRALLECRAHITPAPSH